jgi:hypothetical protein
MKSPLEYASRCLQDIEERWIPYSSLWWRIWTPSIGRGERYHEGYFSGYTNTNNEDEDDDDDDDDDDTEDMPALDIRRMLAMPFVRRIYKKLPYIDVVPVRRPWDDMDEEQQRRRQEFVIESTMAAYDAGKALYPRETIRQIEEQLEAAARKMERRTKGKGPLQRLRRRLCEGCEAPQTTWIKFAAFDGVVEHVQTWAPGAEQTVFAGEGEYYNTLHLPGRPQVEFRTIQELTMPDPEAWDGQFVPDGWQPSVAYSPISVQVNETPTIALQDDEDERMTWADMMGQLGMNQRTIRESPEWKCFEDEGVRPTLQSIDKVVFFYGRGLTDESDVCKRAMFLFALVARLRKFAQDLRGRSGPPIPIYMPAYDFTRTWNETEKTFLQDNGVVIVEPNGELFLKVDERTVVVAYRNRNPVKQVVADLAKPAVLICTPVSEDPDQDFAWVEEDRDGDTVRVPKVRGLYGDLEAVQCGQDSPRTRKLVKDYDSFALPELPAHTGDEEVMTMYVRKAGVCTKVDYR